MSVEKKLLLSKREEIHWSYIYEGLSPGMKIFPAVLSFLGVMAIVMIAGIVSSGFIFMFVAAVSILFFWVSIKKIIVKIAEWRTFNTELSDINNTALVKKIKNVRQYGKYLIEARKELKESMKKFSSDIFEMDAIDEEELAENYDDEESDIHEPIPVGDPVTLYCNLSEELQRVFNRHEEIRFELEERKSVVEAELEAMEDLDEEIVFPGKFNEKTTLEERIEQLEGQQVEASD